MFGLVEAVESIEEKENRDKHHNNTEMKTFFFNLEEIEASDPIGFLFSGKLDMHNTVASLKNKLEKKKRMEFFSSCHFICCNSR